MLYSLNLCEGQKHISKNLHIEDPPPPIALDVGWPKVILAKDTECRSYAITVTLLEF